MEKIINISSFLLIIFLLINVINASNNVIDENKDQYYLISVNNAYGEFKVYTKPNKSKRSLSKAEKFIFSFINEVHELIVENKSTYEDQDKLEEIESTGKLRKRSTDNEEVAANYGDSEFIHPIASVDGSVIFNAYLSKVLADEIAEYDDVESISPVTQVEINHQNYSKDDILEETKWKDLSVKEDADKHLSLISQGKYNEKFADEYDYNYYYPSTAGKDVDIVIIDTSFNFKYFEFENSDDRIIKCVAKFDRGQIMTDPEYSCGYSYQKHGEQVADAAAGLKHGVAPRANIYALALRVDRHFGTFSTNDIIAALGYASERLVRQHKTVINMSLSGPTDIHDVYYTASENLINDLTNKGGIVVVSAGNASTKLVPISENEDEVTIPCQFKNTICVGGIDSKNTTAMIDTYKKADHSNYGANVDIFAPFFVQTQYIDNEDKVIGNQSPGTSFSSPMTAGLIATIISENPNIRFNRDSMLNYLLKNAVPFEVDNKVCYFINNGKHIVYSANNKYNSCGIFAGNTPCKDVCNDGSVCKLQKIKNNCDATYGSLTYVDEDNYACLIQYNGINPGDYACFIGNGKEYCVKSGSTSYNECNKDHHMYDTQKCIKNIYKLFLKTDNQWESNLRSVNQMEWYTDDVELDRKACEGNGGILLSNSYEHICVSNKINESTSFCIRGLPILEGIHEENTYCIDNLHSNVYVCDKQNYGSYDYCYKIISELSEDKFYKIEQYHN